MIDYYAPNIDLTLLGCGFLANYHLGAIYLLSQVWPHRPFNRVCGASCGGLVAALMAAGVPFDEALENSMNVLTKLRAFLKNPSKGLPSIHELLEQLLETVLPKDAHKVCTNRLGISITSLWSLENIFACQFESRRELIDAVTAGCFIPLWSGKFEFPTYRGQKCVDGGYSDNIPRFPAHHNGSQDHLIKHVKSCAFASDADVSPPERYGLFSRQCFGTVYYFNWDSIRKGRGILFPLDEKHYRQYLTDGFRDMKDYILKNDLIKCQQCSWLARPPPASRWSCLSCLKLMEKVDSLKIPQDLLRLVGRDDDDDDDDDKIANDEK